MSSTEAPVIMRIEPVAEQGSQAWIAQRLGHCTASRFADVMTNPRNKSATISKTAETYMIDLMGEILTGLQASEMKTKEMKWGNEWEPIARDAYRQQTNLDVQQVGFVKHSTERFVGCSPDSLVDETGSLEIKCPMTAANHLRVLLSGCVPEDHTEQIQGVMWVTKRQWCDFVTFHPKFPPELRLCVIRVQRDSDFIEMLNYRVLAFRDEMISRLKKLATYWERLGAA